MGKWAPGASSVNCFVAVRSFSRSAGTILYAGLKCATLPSVPVGQPSSYGAMGAARRVGIESTYPWKWLKWLCETRFKWPGSALFLLELWAGRVG